MRPLRFALPTAAFLVLATVPAAAVPPVDTWVPRAVDGPAARQFAQSAYDAARGELVVFGGLDRTSVLGDTWTWDGTTWTHETPATAPPARYLGAMAYDSTRGEVVLFGGQDDDELFGDTWVWNGTTWAQRTPATSPNPTAGHALADDGDGLVLFGGTNNFSAETWTWDGTTWTEVYGPAPEGRAHAAMAYDAARGEVVLFGGIGRGDGVTPQSQYLGDTWVWDGTSWARRTTPVAPPGRYFAGLAVDPTTSRVLLVGGSRYAPPSFTHADLWAWDGTAWTELHPAVPLPPRMAPAIGGDTARGEVVVFGGALDNQWLLGDTWAFRAVAP